MAKKRRSSQFKDTSQVIDIEEARKKRQEKRQKQQQRTRQREEMIPKRAVRASVKAGRRKKHLIYAGVIIAIIAAVTLSIWNIFALKAEYNDAKLENQRLTEEKQALEQQLQDSSEDAFIENEARLQLRMVKPGETVYIVPTEEIKPTENNKESDKE